MRSRCYCPAIRALRLSQVNNKGFDFRLNTLLASVPPLCAFALSTFPPVNLTEGKHIVSRQAGPAHLSARYYLTLEDIG